MANYNPYVRLERLSFSVIERFLSISHSSLEKQPEKKTERPSRLAKQKVKTYCLERFYKDESSEVDESLEKETGRPSRLAKSEENKRKRQNTGKVKGLTEYEKLILKNKKERNAFLDSLKIKEVKESFSEAVNGYKKCVRPQGPLKSKPVIVPRLKIARSSKVSKSLSEKAIEARSDSIAMKALEAIEEEKERKMLPALFHLQDVLDSGRSYEGFIHDLKGLDQGNTEPIDNYESCYQDMELLESHIVHLNAINCRAITAMDIHPMRENTIIAAGGLNGKLFLHNINSDSDPYAFQVHSRHLSHLKFNPENPHLVVSNSTDGTLKKGDLVANVYKRITSASDCSYFDFLNPDTCLVSHRDGYVSVVDTREKPTKNIKRHMIQCNDCILRSVSVHPVNKNEFITPSSKGIVRLWDLRKLKGCPVMEVSDHIYNNEALNSAIFSPLTGKSVLTTSASSRICTFDTSLWPKNPNRILTIKRRGRCSPTWQPRTDSTFAVRSRKFPSRIVIYNNEKMVLKYKHELVQGTISFCTFHPSLPIIAAAGNSIVYVYTNKDLSQEGEFCESTSLETV